MYTHVLNVFQYCKNNNWNLIGTHNRNENKKMYKLIFDT